MSVIASAVRRPWAPVAAGAVMVAIVAAAALTGTDRAPTRGGSSEDFGVIAVPELAQADWKIAVRPAGVIGKIHKEERVKLAHQRHALRGLVRDVYGALFLNPQRISTVLYTRFSKTSASAFRHARAGIPKDMTSVRTKKRVAQVSVDATGARRAVASVTVVAKGVVKGQAVKIAHSSRLWLERDGKRWRIIAFDVDQRPLR